MKSTNEASKLIGVSRRTLQYYDNEGIIIPERSEKKHRLYAREALERIWQVMVYKEMGFELKDIKQILAQPKEKRKEYLVRQMDVLKSQITVLKVQLDLASFVQTHGMPPAPAEDGGVTYVSSIAELKHAIQKEENSGKSA